jgi:ribose-phosphate pyrophosphokinase
MLKLNLVDQSASDINYTIHKFPDGQQSITIEQPYVKIAHEAVMIIARLNSFRHLEVIIAANQALLEIGCTEIHLKVPYFLGSRSDRKFEEGSINYLKRVITPIINSQGFKKVYVIDPHSDVLEALIDGYHKLDNQFLVKWALTKIDNKDGAQARTALISPDAGALKKIFDIAKAFAIENVITAAKVRDLKTGKILKTELPNTDWTGIEQAVIVDDICDGGRTFVELAKAIRETGYTGKIFLVVTHGIFSQSFLELSRHFDKVFSSNSYSDIKCDEHSDYTVSADFLEQLNVLQ